METALTVLVWVATGTVSFLMALFILAIVAAIWKD